MLVPFRLNLVWPGWGRSRQAGGHARSHDLHTVTGAAELSEELRQILAEVLAEQCAAVSSQ
jgi:hypothetical protein